MWLSALIFALLFALRVSRSELLTAVIVEPVLSLTLVDSLLNARGHLKHQYPIVLLTAQENWSFFEQPIWLSLNVKLLRNESVPKNRDQYSDKLIGCEFWQHFDTEFVLIFQSDSRFCSTSPHSIEQFMVLGYPYLGAPWRANGGVGNGGFSLRLLKATRAACNSSAPTRHEDSYYSDYFRANAAQWPNAPLPIAEKFASETYFPIAQNVAPLGIHKAYVYQKGGRLRTVCPEFNVLARLKTEMGAKKP